MTMMIHEKNSFPDSLELDTYIRNAFHVTCIPFFDFFFIAEVRQTGRQATQ